MAYTCPIHPEIRRKAPGKCPKCGADLVPVGTTPHDSAARQEDVGVYDLATIHEVLSSGRRPCLPALDFGRQGRLPLRGKGPIASDVVCNRVAQGADLAARANATGAPRPRETRPTCTA